MANTAYLVFFEDHTGKVTKREDLSLSSNRESGIGVAKAHAQWLQAQSGRKLEHFVEFDHNQAYYELGVWNKANTTETTPQYWYTVKKMRSRP